MKQWPKTIFVATLALAVLGGCSAPPERQQEQAGVVIGAVAGGLLGSQLGHGSGRTAATIIGTMVGAVVGGNVGRSMDEADRVKTAHALETVRTGVPSRWRNPDTGHQYTVVPTRTYEAGPGPCREYTVDAVVGGRTEKVYGTACRQPDGSWRASN
jgi:surface antigen